MILFLVFEDSVSTYFLKPGLNTVSNDTVFYRTRNTVFLRKCAGVYCPEEGPLTIGSSFEFNVHGNSVRGYITAQDQGFVTFRYYESLKEMKIGSSIEDSVYIGDQNLKSRIVLKGNEIEEIGEPAVLSVNGKRIQRCSLSFGDHVEVLNWRMVFGNSFVMMNTCANVFTDLKEMKFKKAGGPLPYEMHMYPETTVFRPAVKPLTIDLLEPLPLMRRNRNPLIFSIGPTLTMASASLISGYLSFSNGLNNGRSPSELMPVLILPMVMLISALLWNPLQRQYEKHLEIKENNRRLEQYREYLEEVELECEKYVRRWKEDLLNRYPAKPWDMASGRHEPVLRLGTCTREIPITFQRRFRISADDPVHSELNRMMKRFKNESGIPLVLDLSEGKQVHFRVERKEELFEIFFHLMNEETMNIYSAGVFLLEEQKREYPWLYLIPHLQLDGSRWLMSEASMVREFIAHSERQEKMSLLFDLTGKLNADFETERVALIRIDQNCGLHTDHVRVDYGRKLFESDRERIRFEPDLQTPKDPYVFFERMIQKESASLRDLSVYSLFGSEKAEEVAIEENWNSHLGRHGLSAPIGWNRSGNVISMDLSENGMGSHGLIAGTTGSGKSAWIVMFILSFACTYSPRELQFAILDFKGGGASSSFISEDYRLPHLSGVLTDLDGEDMKRALTSFRNECRRREELFREMGRISGHTIRELHEYQTLHDHSYNLPYLPELILIIDEFAEMKNSNPEYIRELVSLARTGRSLGIHLILATQKPAGVIDEQIWSNTGFKVAMRVQSRQDSMEILHTPDAAFLRDPGEFCLLHNGILEKGKCAYPFRNARKTDAVIHRLDDLLNVVDYEEESGPSQLENLLNRMKQIPYENAGYRLWLPMLAPVIYPTCCKDMEYAILDDYEKGIQPKLRLEENDRLVCVYTLDRQEKIRFLRSMIYGILSAEEPFELLIHDPLELGMEYVSEDGRIMDILSDQDVEKTANALKYLKQAHAHRVIVVLTDTSLVYSMSEPFRSKFHELYEHADRYSLNFVLFGTASDSIPYRDLSLADVRIALKNENLQELSSIFETAVRTGVKKKNSFLYRRDRLIQGLYFNTLPDISKIIRKDCCSYRIPCMPNMLKVAQYPGKGIAIGMDYETYEWVAIDEKESITVIVVSDSERKRFEKVGIKADFIPVYDLNHYSGIFHERILLTYEAYRMQFRFRLSQEQHPTRKDGILFENEEGRLIRLVE